MTNRKRRNIFLADGLGAILSTLFLTFLSYHEAEFGMPQKILHNFIVIGIILSIYSLGCYLQAPKKWKFYLAIIAVANLLYCCITTVAVLQNLDRLTTIGKLYFVAELIIIVALALYELKTANTK